MGNMKPFTLRNGIQTLQREEDGAVWLDQSKGSSRSGWFTKDPSGRIVQAPDAITPQSGWTKGVSSKVSQADIDAAGLGSLAPGFMGPIGAVLGAATNRAGRYLAETFSPNGTNVYGNQKAATGYQAYTAPTIDAGRMGGAVNALSSAAPGFLGGTAALGSMVGRVAGEGLQATGDILSADGVKGFGKDVKGYFSRINEDPEHTFSGGDNWVGKTANLAGEVASYAGPTAAARAIQLGAAAPSVGMNLLASANKAILPGMMGESAFGGFNQARDQGATTGEAMLVGGAKGATTGLLLGVAGKYLGQMGLEPSAAHGILRDVMAAGAKAGILASGDTVASNFIENQLAQRIGQRLGKRPEEIQKNPLFHGFLERAIPFLGFELGHVAGSRAGLHGEPAAKQQVTPEQAGAEVASGQAPIQVEHQGMTFRFNPADKSTVVIGPDGAVSSLDHANPVHAEGANLLTQAFTAASVTQRPDGSLTTQDQAAAEAARAQASMNPHDWALQRRADELEAQARLQAPMVGGNMGFVQGGAQLPGLGPERTLHADIRGELNPQSPESATAPAFAQAMPGTAPMEGLGNAGERRVTVAGEGAQAVAPGHQVEAKPALPGAQGVEDGGMRYGFASNDSSADLRHKAAGLPPARASRVAHSLVAGTPEAKTELIRTGPTEAERVQSAWVQSALEGARRANEEAGKPSEYPTETQKPAEPMTRDRVRNTIVAGNDNLQADAYPREATTERQPGVTPDRVRNTIAGGQDLPMPDRAAQPEATQPADLKPAEAAAPEKPKTQEPPASLEDVQSKWADHPVGPETIKDISDWVKSGDTSAIAGDSAATIEQRIRTDIGEGNVKASEVKQMILDMVAAKEITPTDARILDRSLGLAQSIAREAQVNSPIGKLAQEASAAIEGSKDELGVRRAANDLVKAIAEKGIKTWNEFVASVRHSINEAGHKTMRALEAAWDRLAKTLGLEGRNKVTFDQAAAQAAKDAGRSEAEADAYGKLVGQAEAVRGEVGKGKSVEITKKLIELDGNSAEESKPGTKDKLYQGKTADTKEVSMPDREVADSMEDRNYEHLSRTADLNSKEGQEKLWQQYRQDKSTNDGRNYIGDRGFEYLSKIVEGKFGKMAATRIPSDLASHLADVFRGKWQDGIVERLKAGEGNVLHVILGAPGTGKSTAMEAAGKERGAVGALELVGQDGHFEALKQIVKEIEQASGKKLRLAFTLVSASPEEVGGRLVDRGMDINRPVSPSVSGTAFTQSLNTFFKAIKNLAPNDKHTLVFNDAIARKDPFNKAKAVGSPSEIKAFLHEDRPDVLPLSYLEQHVPDVLARNPELGQRGTITDRILKAFNDRVAEVLRGGGDVSPLLYNVLSRRSGDARYGETFKLYDQAGHIDGTPGVPEHAAEARPGVPGEAAPNGTAGAGEGRGTGSRDANPARDSGSPAPGGQGEGARLNQTIKGEIEFHDELRSTINLHKDADPSTLLHETFHAIRRRLQTLNPELHGSIEKAFGVKDGNWTVQHEEHFARAAELYAHEGLFPTNPIEEALGYYRDSLREVYGKDAKGTDIDVKLTPEMRTAFGAILDPESATRIKIAESPISAAMDAVRFGAKGFGDFVRAMRNTMGNKAFERFRAENGGTKGLMDLHGTLSETMRKPVDESTLLSGGYDKAMADPTGKTADDLGSVHAQNILKEVTDRLYQQAGETPAQKPNREKLDFKGKDFKGMERLMDLPTRLAQKYPQTFGWVHSSIERFNHAIHVHESFHGEARAALAKLTPEEQRKVFEFQVENRFKDAGNDTRGYIPGEAELKREGFTPEMIEAYHGTLQDYAQQFNKVTDLMKSKLAELKVAQAFDRAKLQDELKAATDAKEKASIQSKLDGMDDGIARAQALVDKYENIIKREKAYVPLIRDGNLFKYYYDKETNELVGVVSGKTEKDLAKKAELWEKANPDLADPSKTKVEAVYKDPNGPRRQITNADQATVVDAAKALGMSEDQAFSLAQMFDAEEREAKSLRGFKKHMREAQGVLGYEIDPQMAHAKYTSDMARFQAGLKHGGEINNRLARLHEDGHTEMENYLRKLHQDVINNPVNPLIAKLMQVVSVKSLGLNPGFVAQQVAQKFSHDLPTLVSIYGKEAIPYWSKAGKIATAHLGSEEVTVKPEDLKGLVSNPEAIAKDLNKALADAYREGIFMSPDIAENARAKKGIGIGGDKAQQVFNKASDIMDKTQEKLFWFISKSENHNRRQTFIAQYLMARELGYPAEKGFDPNVEPDKIGRATGGEMVKLGHDAAQRLTEKQISWIHNERGVANRSEFQRAANGLGMIPSQYRYFLMEYMQQMAQIHKQGYERLVAQGMDPLEARVKASAPVAMSVGAMSAAAGFHGLPMLGMMIMAAAKLWNDGLGPMLGQTPMRSPERFAQAHGIPRWLFSGLPTLVNYNMENAIGVGDPLNLQRKDKAMDIALKVGLGPTQGIIEDTGKTWRNLTQGNVLKAVSTMPIVPKGVSNIAKAASGEAIMADGGRVKMTPGERLGVGLGFRSDRLNRVADEVSQIQDEKQNAASFVQGASAMRPGVLSRYNRTMASERRVNEIATGPMIRSRIEKDAEARQPKGTAQALRQLGFSQR